MTQELPEIAVMLSAGQHPASARARASMADRRSVGIAMAARCARPLGLHAGEFDATVAYDFFAVGVDAIQTLECSAGNDPLPLLVAWWRKRKPAITLFGDRAEQGASTGTLPYFFAEKTGAPLISGVISISRCEDGFEVIQAVSSSVRRHLLVQAPFVAISSTRSPLPTRYSHAAARSGRPEAVALRPAEGVPAWPTEPIHTTLRPMALRSDFGRTLEQRLGALMGGDGVSRESYLDAKPDDAAQLIVNALETLELIDAHRAVSQ